MEFTKSLASATLAIMVLLPCHAEAGNSTIPTRTLKLVQMPAEDLRCKADGKDYSIGAVLIVEKAAFQCIQSFQSPYQAQALSTAWVQIVLSIQDRQPHPYENGEKMQ